MRTFLVAILVSFVTAAPAAATPSAVFTFRPDVPYVGGAVSLWAGNSICDAKPCSYRWTRVGEDGKLTPLGRGRSLVVRFATEGEKVVELTVTNRRFRAPPGPTADAVRRVITVLPLSPTIDAGPSLLTLAGLSYGGHGFSVLGPTGPAASWRLV